MDEPRRLLLVEDEPILAGLIRDSLATEGFTIETAHSAVDGVRVARSFDPDIAILDINLGPGPSGIDLAFLLDREFPGIALLILTQHPDLRTAGFEKTDLPEGCGFLRKDAVQSKADILDALGSLVSPRRHEVRQDGDPSRPLSGLTQTQVDVLRMVAQGYTNQEIARRRGTSMRAVEQTLNLVFLNLGINISDGINPRVEAVRRFIEVAGQPGRD